jgi:molybdopterin converting factor small subunit
MTVKYFGKISEITRTEEEAWEMDEINISDFRDKLYQKYPELTNQTIKIAVNSKIQFADFLIASTDEVAILPPFSGG